MKPQLQDDLKTAMKAGDKARVMTIRGVLSEITRLEKDVRHEATKDEILQILKRERARRDEALEFARKANRADVIEQNEVEARVLDAYLPAALSADEVSAAIKVQIESGVMQMGPLMKALRDQFGAQLDGKMASELVKQALARK